MNENDMFCEDVISKKVPVEVIKETDSVLAFRHTKPRWKTHIVVTPKKHFESLIDLANSSDDILVKDLLSVSAEVAESIKNSEGGCVISTSVGSDQYSKHFHVDIHHGEDMLMESTGA
jgi:histidine triad (HIT) family protein